MPLYHRHYKVTGIVQGVGFRPFCKRLADTLCLKGSIRNTGDGVELHLFGTREALERYGKELRHQAPPLAQINTLEPLAPEKELAPSASLPAECLILESGAANRGETFIPPDVATCPECLRDMEDPSNPRYRYPFTNCTNCGPRFTIIRDLPYDRPQTTMKDFPLCELCAGEYADPQNRRYHAQPVACPECGPRLYGSRLQGPALEGEEALEQAVRVLREGGILALKGLGGFHLACDPRQDAPLEKLRRYKNRKDKPFALMARNIEEASHLVLLSEKDKEVLRSPEAPILLCSLRPERDISSLVAPAQHRLGIMLPYTPLHHLLLRHFSALVMTSANPRGEPLTYRNEEALNFLTTGEANLVLWHNRDILHPIDDSLLSSWKGGYYFLRRARGYAPAPFFLKKEAPPLCAAGSEMKSTFALSQKRTLLCGPYLGDLKNMGTCTLYKNSLAHFLRLFRYRPEYLACDLHPQFLSTALARDVLDMDTREKEKILPVQHHHAHFASCLFEHGMDADTRALGIILDGTGYGPDGTIWGGEFLVGSLSHVTRRGALLPFPLFGGDKAAEEPWRSAAALLFASYSPAQAREMLQKLWPHREALIRQLPLPREACISTTSAGRLFDGFSALITGKDTSSYDGQAPLEMEALASEHTPQEAPFDLLEKKGLLFLDWRPSMRWIVEKKNVLSLGELAGGIHRGFARGLSRMAEKICRGNQLSSVALSGGVWQNRFLLNETCTQLERRGLHPLVHRRISPNDEGIAPGQILVASAQLMRR